MKTPAQFFRKKEEKQVKPGDEAVIIPWKKIMLSIVALAIFIAPATILGIQVNKEARVWRDNWDVVTYAKQNPDIVRQVKNKHGYLNRMVRDEVMAESTATPSSSIVPTVAPTATPVVKKVPALK